MHQDKPKEIVIITSQDGIWREEKISLAARPRATSEPLSGEEGPPDPGAERPGIDRGWSPFQWKRKYKEFASPGYESAMKGLRNADNRIARFSDELNYLANLLPSDPTKLPDIALILIEIKQRLDSIVTAGRQVTPAKDKKLQDFYGRFRVKIPKNLRTPGKIATAGLIGDFVRFLGKKIFEYTDTDIREMKRVVKHLLNTTKQTVKTINKVLDDMRSARKTGDIDKYIEGVRFISKEQGDFRREFSAVYDSYLKDAYQHAYALEQEEKAKAKAEGREHEESFDDVSFEKGELTVNDSPISPTEEQVAPLDEAAKADKSPDTVRDSAISEEHQQAIKQFEEHAEKILEMQRSQPDLIDMKQVQKNLQRAQEALGLTPEEVAETRVWQRLTQTVDMPPPLTVDMPPEDFEGTRQVDMGDVVRREQEAEDQEHAALLQKFHALRRDYGDEPAIDWWRRQMKTPVLDETIHDFGLDQTIHDFGLDQTMRQPAPNRPGAELGETLPSGVADPRMEAVEGRPPSSSEPEVSPYANPNAPKHLRVDKDAIQPPFADDGHPSLASDVEVAMAKVAHTRFLSELGEIAEKENKYIVAAFMARYSEELEKTNPHASAALLRAAQEISND